MLHSTSKESNGTKWDIQTLRSNIHRIVRIARTVVSPEFRGFGIGRLLVQHAASFARERWQIANKKPFFLEISADMLKFVPFVQKAGLSYVGETSGNLERVTQDITYLLQRFGDGQKSTSDFEKISGILDQQVARMNQALRLMKEQGIPKDTLLTKLRRLSSHKVLKDFDLFRGIVSLPKPTFMMGLNAYSQGFITNRLNDLKPTEPPYAPNINIQALNAPVRLSNVTITYVSKVPRTLATHAIQQAFDISPRDIRTTAVHNLTFEVHPGEILLIEGPSGSGKTTLLEAIAGEIDTTVIAFEGEIDRPSNLSSYLYEPVRSRKSLIELFGSGGIRKGLSLLALAGLSEPFLYLKRFHELSKGQQYRAMLAQMLASGRNVWLADEFCASLDEITANLVAHNIQRIARQLGLTVIVAASNPKPFVYSLKPDKVVRLTSAAQSSTLNWKEYLNTTLHGSGGSSAWYPSESHSLLSPSTDVEPLSEASPNGGQYVNGAIGTTAKSHKPSRQAMGHEAITSHESLYRRSDTFQKDNVSPFESDRGRLKNGQIRPDLGEHHSGK